MKVEELSDIFALLIFELKDILLSNNDFQSGKVKSEQIFVKLVGTHIERSVESINVLLNIAIKIENGTLSQDDIDFLVLST